MVEAFSGEGPVGRSESILLECAVNMILHKVRSKDGTSIAYEEFGAGPPLVLVHGGDARHDCRIDHAQSRKHEQFLLDARSGYAGCGWRPACWHRWHSGPSPARSGDRLWPVR